MMIGFENHQIDITDEDSIWEAVSFIDGELDIVLIATGLLHGDDGLMPEKSLRDVSLERFEEVFRVNTIGPALAMKHFALLLPKDRRAVMAAISARVGSIGDNRLGGWYAYRASKAALNMVIKNAAIEIGRRYKQAVIIGLHPGTVETELSAPFRGNVSGDKLFTAEFAAEKLVGVMGDVSPSDSGKVFAWDGAEIEP